MTAVVTIDRPADWLPHRGSMLLVDRACAIEPGKRGTAELFLGAADPRFAGHFPGAPILPGIFLIEAVTQAGALILMAAGGPPEHRPDGMLGAVDRFKFFEPVRPETRLTIVVEIEERFGNLAKVRGEVRAGDTVVASGTIVFSMSIGKDE
jgi:3-hydroxyacyl-[acyl-carrier-protein] dehydratase